MNAHQERSVLAAWARQAQEENERLQERIKQNKQVIATCNRLYMQIQIENEERE
jgi:hypothetical protein